MLETGKKTKKNPKLASRLLERAAAEEEEEVGVAARGDL